MDGPYSCNIAILSSFRTHWLKSITTVFGSIHRRFSCGYCLALVLACYSLYIKCSFWLPPTVLSISRSSRFSPLKVSNFHTFFLRLFIPNIKQIELNCTRANKIICLLSYQYFINLQRYKYILYTGLILNIGLIIFQI